MKDTITTIFFVLVFSGFNCHGKIRESQPPAMYESKCRVVTWQDINNKSRIIDSSLQALANECKAPESKRQNAAKNTVSNRVWIENPNVDTAKIFTILNDSNK